MTTEAKPASNPACLRAATLVNNEQALAKRESGLYPSDHELATIIERETGHAALVAACEAALEWLECNRTDPIMLTDDSATGRQLRAALALAKGEQTDQEDRVEEADDDELDGWHDGWEGRRQRKNRPAAYDRGYEQGKAERMTGPSWDRH